MSGTGLGVVGWEGAEENVELVQPLLSQPSGPPAVQFSEKTLLSLG